MNAADLFYEAARHLPGVYMHCIAHCVILYVNASCFDSCYLFCLGVSHVQHLPRNAISNTLVANVFRLKNVWDLGVKCLNSHV